MEYRLLLAAAVASGCAHLPLSESALNSIDRPAFIARIEDGAGPHSTVFRDDTSSYQSRLKRLDAKEADRRLRVKLENGTDAERSMNRWQVAHTIQATVIAELPRGIPWSNMAPPTAVATALESYLVHEVPANAPDVSLLAPLGVDSIVEIVVEDYGLRSEKGKAGIFFYGHARFYRMSGATLYRRSFFVDELSAGIEGLDPFEVAKHPSKFASRLKLVLTAVAHQIAADLSPGPRPTKPSARQESPSPKAVPPPEDDPL